jgi:hypothetical protein
LGGRVISVTTDGFLTDVSNLEEAVLKNNNKTSVLLRVYKSIREVLCNDSNSLELKGVNDRMLS